MRKLVIGLVFGLFLGGFILVSCSTGTNESVSAPPPEEPIVTPGPMLTPSPEEPNVTSGPMFAPPPSGESEYPEWDVLPQAEELPSCSTCPLLKPISQREFSEEEYKNLLKRDAGLKDIQAFAGELGYEKFITAGEITFDDQSILTTGIYASRKDEVVLVHSYQAKTNAYFLRQFENYQLKDEEIVSGTMHVFDRSGGAWVDLMTGEMWHEGGHNSCNFWHCFGTCISFVWSNYSVGYFCKLWIPECIADLTRVSCLPLVFCGTFSGSYCYTSCEINECNFCKSDDCGEDEDTGIPECVQGYGYWVIVQPYKHYYCATDPVYFYDAELAECEWEYEERRLEYCPQGCFQGKCATFTPSPSITITSTPSKSATVTQTFTPSKTGTKTKTSTPSKSATITPTRTPTKSATPTVTPTPTPSPTRTNTITSTPVLGIHINGFVGEDSSRPYEYGLDGIFIYVYWEYSNELVMADITQKGDIQKVWVPYTGESDVYVFVTSEELDWLEAFPPKTEFDPDYYQWYHKIGEETVTLEFYLDKE